METQGKLIKCPGCSGAARSIYHVGPCPGFSSSALNRVISPFPRTSGEEKDRRFYSKAAPWKSPRGPDQWGRGQNGGAYASRPQPLRIRKRGAVSVSMARGKR